MWFRVRKGVEMEDTLIQATAENPSGQTQDGDQAPLSPPFRSSEDIRGRVVGGTLADVKNFPWQVSLHVGFSHQCGGSILTKSWKWFLIGFDYGYSRITPMEYIF